VPLEQLLVDVFENVLPSHEFEEREGQEFMAFHAGSIIKSESILIAEAGVGIGKTFAYLIPALLAFDWSSELIKKTLAISTNTIVLQHQLISDIKRLVGLLNIDIDPNSIALAKGKTNFLCPAKAINPKVLLEPELREWINSTTIGDRNDAPPCSDLIWQRICADGSDDCNRCYYRNVCGYQKERTRWSEARIVVTNHQQLLADALNRETNPRMALFRQPDMVVIDEAHRFEEAAAQMLGSLFTLEDIRRIPKRASRLEQRLLYPSTCSSRLEELGPQLMQSLNDAVEWKGEEESGRAFVHINKEIKANIYKYLDALDEVNRLQALSKDTRRRFSEFDNMSDRLITTMEALVSPAEFVCWAEMKDANLESINAMPRDMTRRLGDLLWNCKRPMILTSATLTGNGPKDYDYFSASLGLRHAKTMSAVPSPFDYENNRFVYLPPIESMPDYRSEEFLRFAAEEIANLVRAVDGRTLILMTSHNDMNVINDMLQSLLPDYNLLLQGQERQGKLIERFEQSPRSVLLGTAYWEGVDIPGMNLMSVICPRLPFPPPDPVLEAKSEEARKRNIDDFTTVYLSEMLMKLKQGFGRLIRTSEDFGVLSILDRRAHAGQRKYSSVIHDLLKPSEVTHSLRRVKGFVSDKQKAAS
jgi:ATP-dependent DNA helicase DinG